MQVLIPRLYKDALSNSHLMIAGTTGSGKSTVINGLIYTLIARPATDNKLILIDPKKVELSRFQSAPHTIRYADNSTSILAALQYAKKIMDIRFNTMQTDRIRESRDCHIWIIIDEWLDIKYTIGKQAENYLIKIAAMGRAAHIHIILATQRPTADCVNAVIKANFPARIALRTATKQESRNIAGIPGCETFPLHGSCYYVSPALCEPEYRQIQRISDTEIERLLEYRRNQKAARIVK